MLALLTSRWAVALGAVALVAGTGWWSGWKSHDSWVHQPAIRKLQSHVDGVKALFDAYKARTEAERERAAAEASAKEARLLIEADRRRVEYAKRVAELDRKLRVATDELRSERDAARANLRPAEASPADCRGYAAGAGQLSVSDASFLIGEAGRADRLALRLNACIAAYERASAAFGG